MVLKRRGDAVSAKSIVALLIISALVAGCIQQAQQTIGTKESLKYAKLFSVEKHEGYTIVRDSIGRGIVLWNKTKPDIKADLFIKTPVRRVVVLSTTDVAYIEAINSTNAIVGVPSVSKWYFEDIKEGLRDGRIKEVGKAKNPDYEKIINLKPDLVFISPKFVGIDVIKKIESLDIPYVSCDYWVEKDPLGKLEWVKLFGLFFDRSDTAKKYFVNTEKKILQVEKKVRGQKKPRVIYALTLRGKILVPGNQSYHAKLVRMAGGEYAFGDLNSSKYVSVGTEEFLERVANSDVYIAIYMGVPVKSIKDLIEQIPGLAETKPFKEGRVYAMQPWIWQLGYIHPEKVIEDTAAIIHPDKFSMHGLKMFKKL